jgi:hypothetical protein
MLTVLCLDHHKYPARRDQQIVRKCDSVWINDNVRFLSRRTFLEKDGMSGVNKGDLNRRRRIPVLIPFVPKEMHSSRPSLLHTYIHTGDCGFSVNRQLGDRKSTPHWECHFPCWWLASVPLCELGNSYLPVPVYSRKSPAWVLSCTVNQDSLSLRRRALALPVPHVRVCENVALPVGPRHSCEGLLASAS